MPRKTKPRSRGKSASGKKAKKTKKEYTLERPPVVTMLGHVDHGKTSILDAIRGTKVQACEAGGITQNVRAHKVEFKTKKGETHKLTFIDTPGHEAFSQMRSRGSKVTDIAVLVVAVDDGVQPQTKEAISFAKEAGVPIIVALNKIDIKGADKAKVRRELSDNGVQVEELGGDVICIETSAKEKKGLDEILEAVLLVAEMNELKKIKPKKCKAAGVVLESTLDKSQGPISFTLIKAGEMKVGDFVTWNGNSEKIRAIMDENFCSITSACDSDPVWLLGFSELIPVGVTLNFYSNLDEVKKGQRAKKKEDVEVPEKIEKEDEEKDDAEILAELLASQDDRDKPRLDLIVKSECQGTLEVVENELKKLPTGEVKINIVDSGTGEITEDDLIKAKTTGGIVVGFKSKIGKKTEKIARIEKVLVRNYEIIYELLEEVMGVVESFIEPEEKEVEVARALVKKVFGLSDGSKVAGCKVMKGIIVKGYRCFVERPTNKKDKRIGDGKIISLKCGKEDVKDAPKGSECGILIEPSIGVEKDDEIVCFKVEKG